MNRPSIGVLVPCRDEAAVIGRKLANLARIVWPSAARPHRIVVVDDGSSDGTESLARRAAAAHFEKRTDVRVDVVVNSGPSGKAHAIARGLEALRDDVELCVLTDADVIVALDALVELARRFDEEPRLGLACGAQRFVEALPDDGDAELVRGDDAGAYDRITAWVRRQESRSGRLFSVHGQWLGWRRDLALGATPGIAADDLDLRLQARARGARVELVDRALFFECKAPHGAARDAQALRRARAYVQWVKSPRVAALRRELGWLDRVQLDLYRSVPLGAPWFVLAGALLVPASFWAAGAPRVALGCVAVVAMFVASPLGRRLLGLFTVIVQATRAERRGTLSGAWTTARR
ncbi:MAG: glycosyltransferase [Planctomycetes bacterium]|nr:glycosyltransferase [Planctomycetota bacterium]